MALYVVLEDGSRVPVYWTKAYLVDRYVVKRWSANRIAKECGVEGVAIRSWLRKHGIGRRRGGSQRSSPSDKVVDGVRMHWCTGHEEYHPATAFSGSSSNPDGLQYRCKAWWHEYYVRPEVKEAQRERTRKLIARPKVIPKEKTCSICGETKSASEFPRSSVNSDGLHSQCKSCFYTRDAFKEGVRRYKMRKKGVPGTHTRKQWRTLCAFFNHTCPCCGKKVKRFAKDHIIPLSWPGSTDDIDNIQPLCTTCNSSKGNGNDIDYRSQVAKDWTAKEMEAP